MKFFTLRVYVNSLALWQPLAKFLTHRVTTETTGEFLPNLFCPHLVTILNFCVKCKNAFILETQLE